MDAEEIVRELAEKVRSVVADAEERAAAIVRDAEEEATGIRARAEEDARRRLDDVQRAVADLQSTLGGSPGAEVTPEPVTVPEPAPPDTPEPSPPDTPEPTPDPVPDPIPGPEPTPGEPAEPAAGGNGGARSTDKAAARLVAMKMALDGAPRDEIDAHLAANYDVENREKLLDDVLARAKA